MKRFAKLIADLENTSKSSVKILLLEQYFLSAPENDKIWAIALFIHWKPKRLVNTRKLSEWAIELAGIEKWLFEESYAVVGDLSETLSLILPITGADSQENLTYWINQLTQLEGADETIKKKAITKAWTNLTKSETFVFNKLITGGFRVGVSKNLIIQSLAKLTGKEVPEVAYRLTGDWDPGTTTFSTLLLDNSQDPNVSRPYPFCLAYPVEKDIGSLGSPSDWIVEWKWDGIRVQLIKRNDQLFLWSRREELITEKFPEFEVIGELLPNGTVMDGELVPFKDGQPLSFSHLQTRIGRKNLSRKILANVPAVIIAFDLLEIDGKDIRQLPLSERRVQLDNLMQSIIVPERIMLSLQVESLTWEDLKEKRVSARAHMAEGFMLKHKNSDYKVGRKRGDWWKWKVDPFSIDAVMIYAQKGLGRRADIYSVYTFGVWDGKVLVPFAKAYSGLADAEMLEVTRFVQNNTIERFGPVRTVPPVQVFELHFEGIQASSRHKSGIAVRFPRIHRWRKDKKSVDANSLEDLRTLLDQYG